jgi:hypothetical protein
LGCGSTTCYNLLYGLLEGFFKVTHIRKDSFHERPVVILKFTDRAGKEMEVTVDRYNYHIVKTNGVIGTGREKAGLSDDSSDFRMVEAISLPFMIVNHASGFMISETSIGKYTINQDISDASSLHENVTALCPCPIYSIGYHPYSRRAEDNYMFPANSCDRTRG